MSLRARLLLTLGITLVLLWGVAAAWLLNDLQASFVRTLDQRLAQSARMVAGLVHQLPPEVWEQNMTAALSIPPIEGLACQVHSPRGEIIARTHANMEAVLAPGQHGHSYRQEGETTWRVFTYERGGLIITTADRMDERNLLLGGIELVAAMPGELEPPLVRGQGFFEGEVAGLHLRDDLLQLLLIGVITVTGFLLEILRIAATRPVAAPASSGEGIFPCPPKLALAPRR